MYSQKKVYRVSLIFKTLLFCFSSYCYGDTTSTCSRPNLQFNQILDELSQSNVRCITQDTYGFIWMGTLEGLNRYDGVNMKDYTTDPKEPHSLSDDNINDLLIDSKQNLWIATYENLIRYNYELEHFEIVKNPINVNSLDAIKLLEDKNKNLWIGTHHGIFIYDSNKNQLRRHRHKALSKLNKLEIYAMTEDSSGRLWLGTNQGVYIVSNNQQEVIKLDLKNKKVQETKINSLLQDTQGNIWIGTENQGLFCVPETKDLKFHSKQYLPELDNPSALGDIKVHMVYEDSQQRIWIGTEKSGLHLYCPERDHFFKYQKNITDEKALKSNSIWRIFEDHSGRLWLGSNYQGAFVYDPFMSKFNFTDKGNGDNIRLKFSTVTSFLEFEDKMWIGTDGGGITEWHQNNNTYKFLSHNPKEPNSLGSDEVLTIFRDSEGIIWTGNWEGGLNRFNSKDSSFYTFKHQQNNPNSLGSNSIFGIDEAKNGDLWMTTWGRGITRYRKSDNTFFNITYVQYDSTHICTPHTYDIEVDDTNGDIWVGTVLGIDLITLINDKEYKIRHIKADMKSPKHLSGNFVQCIFEDSQHRIWIGTDNGLNLYHRDRDRFEKFLPQDGLPGKSVKGIIEDNQGSFWITTTNGMAKLSQKNGLWTFSKFDKSDGLQGKEFFFNSAYKTSNGKIFVGGVNGFNYFLPQQIKDNPHPPKTQLLGFNLFNNSLKINHKQSPLNKSILLTDKITLTHKQYVFSIDYQGVHFTKASQNQYAYKLEGFEQDWNYVGNRTTAIYTNLDPGKYTFLVKSANHHGVWTKDTRRLTIVILPVWWKTWWAKTLLYGSPLCIAMLIFWVRISIMKEQKILLEKEVEKRTTEVLNQKNELENQAIQLQKLNQQKNKLFSVISHDLRSPLGSLTGIAKLLDPQILERKDLIMVKREITKRITGISDVVDDILNWAKGQLDGEVTQPVIIDMYTLGEEMICLYEERAKQKDIILQNKIPKNLQVFADKNQIKVILRNLIANGLKFTPKDGFVDVELYKTDHSFMTFSVKDTGIGMNEEKSKRLFSGQDNISTFGTSGEQGFGLGLMLVKEYVEKNNGKIWVKSTMGKGTSFYFTLPRARNQ